MDNLSGHKVDAVAEVIESIGDSVRYMPPNSSDLNPITLAFA